VAVLEKENEILKERVRFLESVFFPTTTMMTKTHGVIAPQTTETSTTKITMANTFSKENLLS
jgi:hypothetical protein